MAVLCPALLSRDCMSDRKEIGFLSRESSYGEPALGLGGSCTAFRLKAAFLLVGQEKAVREDRV